MTNPTLYANPFCLARPRRRAPRLASHNGKSSRKGKERTSTSTNERTNKQQHSSRQIVKRLSSPYRTRVVQVLIGNCPAPGELHPEPYLSYALVLSNNPSSSVTAQHVFPEAGEGSGRWPCMYCLAQFYYIFYPRLTKRVNKKKERKKEKN